MKTIRIFITLLLLSSLSLTAQNKDTRVADKYFTRFEFNKAIEAYEKLIEKGKADQYVYTKLAEANYNIFNTVEAERWYAKVLTSSQDPETIYQYAQMLKANGKYEESNAQMKKFASMRPGDDRSVAFNKNPDYLPKILDREKKFLESLRPRKAETCKRGSRKTIFFKRYGNRNIVKAILFFDRLK